jgi:hypothetical protein
MRRTNDIRFMIHPCRFIFSSLQRKISFRRGRILLRPGGRTEDGGIAAFEASKAAAVVAAIERESLLRFVKTTVAGMV